MTIRLYRPGEGMWVCIGTAEIDGLEKGDPLPRLVIVEHGEDASLFVQRFAGTDNNRYDFHEPEFATGYKPL